MGAKSVVEGPPAIQENLSVLRRVKDLSVEEFVAEPGMETFCEAILPGFPGFDEVVANVLDTEPDAQITSDIVVNGLA